MLLSLQRVLLAASVEAPDLLLHAFPKELYDDIREAKSYVSGRNDAKEEISRLLTSGGWQHHAEWVLERSNGWLTVDMCGKSGDAVVQYESPQAFCYELDETAEGVRTVSPPISAGAI